ncbi:MAG TPA: DUF4142 domain-containing protein [Rhizobacter sp.]|nr:DUF4142 domain-containing protein [Rhizobacter sp.]
MDQLAFPFRLSVAVAAFALTLAASAQQGAPKAEWVDKSPAAATAGSESQLARADVAFLNQAAENGHAEVEASKLALSKASSSQVKSFAQQMVDDHTKAGDELASLAESKGVKVSSSPSLTQKSKLKLLSALDGQNFDKRYAKTIGVAALEDSVKLFQKAANEAKDADVKAFAARTLPTLQHHLEMAKELKSATGEMSAKATTSDAKQQP